MSYYPEFVRDRDMHLRMLATKLDIKYATKMDDKGLYISIRKQRDPINTNRKRPVYLVQLRRDDGEVAFKERVPIKNFPTDELIAKLLLLA